MTTRVLFVCLGNICRSPTAEVVFRDLATAAGLKVHADSAGTAGWNAGQSPHFPSIEAAAARGYDLRPLRARQVEVSDFARFDLILAMDRSNLRDLQALRPADSTARLGLVMDHAPEAGTQDIPDPWYSRDFNGALDLIEAGCRGLVRSLASEGPAPPRP